MIIRIEGELVSLVLALLALVLVCVGAGVAGTWLPARRRPSGPAVEVDRNKGLYLIFSRLSHSLDTAGKIIIGNLGGFTDDLPRDAERWRVARRAIEEEASALGRLTERLSVIVRVGMAEQPLVMDAVNVAYELEKLLIGLGPAAEAKGIILECKVNNQGRAVPHISADRMALKEVFSILLENAVKHNGPDVQVTGHVHQERDQLVVRIMDNGKGIPQDVLGRVFESGTRGHFPGSPSGTGMGLYLCRVLVQLHGGEITARSPADGGKGTEFRIILPLRRAR